MDYAKLSEELQLKILSDRIKGEYQNPNACKDSDIIRRQDLEKDRANIWRPAFVRDIEKILHSPYYNRYADKTQVFSFYKNDDITRRSLHVQLVARIGRNIGKILGLNEDLIEAIALGHDIGHTPFGHAGERILNKLYHKETGRYFNHNVHSVRVLDQMLCRNLSLQVLDGILCHNGEFEMKEYRPCQMKVFKEYDEKVEACYTDQDNISKLIPCTLEGCVVRISDMIAYLGKDRQDAENAKLLVGKSPFTETEIGIQNANIVNNMIVNIIENSYSKDYILMEEDYFQALKIAKDENYKFIYNKESINTDYREIIEPMFKEVYDKLLNDLLAQNKESILYKHHIDFINRQRKYYDNGDKYDETEPNQIIVDYLASMTDDYFVELHQYLFPESEYSIKYVPYF